MMRAVQATLFGVLLAVGAIVLASCKGEADPPAITGAAAAVDNAIPENLTVDDYIELSLSFYRANDFEKSIAACEKVLAIDPRNSVAHNNICAARTQLKQWDAAVVACEKAVEISPDWDLPQNNLQWAKSEQAKH